MDSTDVGNIRYEADGSHEGDERHEREIGDENARSNVAMEVIVVMKDRRPLRR